MRVARLLCAVLLFVGVRTIPAASYTPILVPTRDGKHLAADLYATDQISAKPVILIQTPYNKNFYRVSIGLPQAGGATFPYDSAHYNYVVLDWRGFYGSIGATAPNYDRGKDGYDAVEWIAQQPWCDGHVGTWGPSALGYIQFQTARYHPPHLVCAVPLVKDFKTQYSNYYYGGVFRTEHVASLDSLGLVDQATILAHPDSDVVWTLAARSTDYPDSIAVPMLMIGGWFDHFPDDVLRAFNDLRTRGAMPARTQHKLIMGPWQHTAIGDTQQGVLRFPKAAGFSDSAAMQFFDHYLRGVQNGYEGEPVVRYYQMGADEWRSSYDWNSVTRGWYIWFLAKDDGGKPVLTPAVNLPGSGDSLALYADPRDPVPTVGGSRFNPFDRSILLGPQDLRSNVESRTDVLSFATPPLTADFEHDGPIHVKLFVRSDRPDIDLAVRLCDVYPDGRSIILTQGIRRARFRDSYATESLLRPDSVYRVDIELQNMAMTFLAGHRLRVDISGSDYPMYDCNLNNGGAMYAAGDTLVAHSMIIWDHDHPSQLDVADGALNGIGTAADVPLTTALSITPNPASSDIALRWDMASPADVRVDMCDVLGRTVAAVYHGPLNQGAHSIVFHAVDLPEGMYWCRLQAGRITTFKPLEIVR